MFEGILNSCEMLYANTSYNMLQDIKNHQLERSTKLFFSSQEISDIHNISNGNFPRFYLKISSNHTKS